MQLREHQGIEMLPIVPKNPARQRRKNQSSKLILRKQRGDGGTARRIYSRHIESMITNGSEAPAAEEGRPKPLPPRPSDAVHRTPLVYRRHMALSFV